MNIHWTLALYKEQCRDSDEYVLNNCSGCMSSVSSPFFRWGNWDQSSISKVAQIVRDETWTGAQEDYMGCPSSCWREPQTMAGDHQVPVGYGWCHRAQCHPEGRAWLDLGVSHLVLIASACCLPAVGLHELTFMNRGESVRETRLLLSFPRSLGASQQHSPPWLSLFDKWGMHWSLLMVGCRSGFQAV